MTTLYIPKFNIGDTVIVHKKPKNCNEHPTWVNDMDSLIGKVGIVTNREWHDDHYIYGVEYRTEKGYVDWWYFRENWLTDKISEKTPKPATYVVDTDNKTYVSVSNWENGDIAFAHCHPDDKFDLVYGVNLAFSRLHERESKPLYNGEVICIDSTNDKEFSVGYAYEIKGGKLINNEHLPACVDIKEMEDIKVDYASFVPFHGTKY